MADLDEMTDDELLARVKANYRPAELGLSKREMIAAMLMQQLAIDDAYPTWESAAEGAVDAADELLTALKKEDSGD